MDKLVTKFVKSYYNFFYNLLLWKLRFVSKFRKIRVGFWVTEPAKWTGQYLYEELKNDNHFTPFILLSFFKKPQKGINSAGYYYASKRFFKEKKMTVYDTFNPDNYQFKNLLSYKPDIIFYQQPWQIHDLQRPEKTHRNALLCYIPYCFYSMNSFVNYLPKFHGRMWKYFVESELHKNDYEKNYDAENCVVSGSVKLDGYHFIDKNNLGKYWKTTDKKRIIYAPHHSFNDEFHDVATFKEDGRFILDLAKSHPDTEWIFRPHPVFKDRILKNSIMSEEEINNYYKEWEKIGSISTGGNYYEMFLSSDLLITDCISFLSEYAPTLKPVLHLKKNIEKDEFNDLVKNIDESYYQIYSNEELEKIFNLVVEEGLDSLKDKRLNNKIILQSDNIASINIYEYIKELLHI